MIRLGKPSRSDMERFIASQASLPFSYADVGATRAEPPRGYTVDRNRILLGQGREAYDRAIASIRRWEMFQIPWLQLCWPEAPIEPGSTVAVLIRRAGFWWLNACRIVYVIAEDGPTSRFGFGYGTLPEHAERGEERFTVEWNLADDSVCYDILAFSRPNKFLSRAAYPFVRRLQKRFARDSMWAMLRAVRSVQGR